VHEQGATGDVTISHALRAGRQRLAPAETETPGLDAEVLLRHVLQLDRAGLFARLSDPVEPRALAAYRRLLDERAAGTPVAYLTGEREFMGLALRVTPNVLIPRPETEILVEWAVAWLRRRPDAVVVDVGTGSGAIALSVATSLGPEWRGRIIASDVSAAALAVARANRERHKLTDSVTLVAGSLLDWLHEPVDLILANLPYLTPAQIAANPQLAAEPRLALAGGAAGLDLIRRLLADAPRVLAPAGAIALEIDPSQRDAVIALATASFPGAKTGVLRDLSGHARHITIERRIRRDLLGAGLVR
jgi:release factor glutamine methyltransferase